MDNITHSLVGALTAETALTFLNIKKPELVISRRTKIAFYLSSFLSNNICDLDFVVGLFLKPNRLQYLLHHRGHTHTFVMAPFQAALIVLLFWGVAKLQKRPWEKFEMKAIAALSLLGCFLHIGLDFLNQYGIHPFWPFNNHWFYADMMFIVEPWIWVTILPFLFFSSSHRYMRWAVVCLIVSAFGLVGLSGFVPKTMGWVVGLWSLILFLSFKYLEQKNRLAVCYFSFGLFLSVFFLECHWLKAEIKERFQKEEPEITLNDVILSPFPSNPVCWQIVTVESSRDRQLFDLRKGVVSLFTHLYRPEECLSLITRKNEAEPLNPKHPHVIWTSHRRYLRQHLVKLWKENCSAAAQLKFVRAPFWYEQDKKLYLADMRFETGGRDNFSKLDISNGKTDCPKAIPPWVEPREDLLRE